MTEKGNMVLDQAVKIGNLVAWAVVGLAFYFTNQTDSAADVYKVNERVSVLEQKIDQEILGYGILQSSIGSRLDRIERKVDCLIDKRLCH